jgi:hypothetical protein
MDCSIRSDPIRSVRPPPRVAVSRDRRSETQFDATRHAPRATRHATDPILMDPILMDPILMDPIEGV